MDKKRQYRRLLIVFIIMDLFALFGYGYLKINSLIPDEIKVIVDNEENISLNLPLDIDMYSEDVNVINVNTKKLESDVINIDTNNTFTIQSSQIGNYNIDLKLFGFIKLKSITLDVIDPIKIVPCGIPVGIYVETDGILVLGTSPITGEDGLNYEPAGKLIKSGDYIISINNIVVKDKNDFIRELKNSKGNVVSIGIRRDNKEKNVNIVPVKTPLNEYKIGIWVRDNTQGIGTLTFMDEEGNFGALGHGINDIDTSVLMEIKNGAIYQAEILSIIKGKNGTPGELIGTFQYSEDTRLGNINKNTIQGVYGQINEANQDLPDKSMPVGFKQDVELGKAYVRCYVEGKMKDYEIEIEKIDISNSDHGKGMIVRITDPDLINTTNGIVQGMSGSPIIQNNKIIGAITHVFVQDSTKGYATFIENMIKIIG